LVPDNDGGNGGSLLTGIGAIANLIPGVGTVSNLLPLIPPTTTTTTITAIATTRGNYHSLRYNPSKKSKGRERILGILTTYSWEPTIGTYREWDSISQSERDEASTKAADIQKQKNDL
ncbi:hypothetical protein BGZ65_011272, partial [Modicella reniformis]